MPGRLRLSSFFSAFHIPYSEHVPQSVYNVTVSFFAYLVLQSLFLEYPGAELARNHRLMWIVETFSSQQTTGPRRKRAFRGHGCQTTEPKLKGYQLREDAPIACSYHSCLMITSERLCVDAIPLQHLVPKLVLLYLSTNVLEYSQPTNTVWMDARCKETACLAVYGKDDSRIPEQLLERRGSGQLQAGWSEELSQRYPEMQQITKHHIFK